MRCTQTSFNAIPVASLSSCQMMEHSHVNKLATMIYALTARDAKCVVVDSIMSYVSPRVTLIQIISILMSTVPDAKQK